MQLRRKDDRNDRPFGQRIGFTGNKQTSQGMNIYIGNLARDVTESDIRTVFGAFGKIVGVKLIKDKFNGEPKGFGFVDMPVLNEAHSAIDKLNGTIFKGQPLKVSEAHTISQNQHKDKTLRHH